MENRKSNYVRILNEICSEEKIELSSYSYDWAFCLKKDNRRVFILGYQFGLNSSSVQQICADKNITSEVLREEGIPSVYHACFMTPDIQGYTGENGSWPELVRRLKSGRLVCKDNYGTGGNMVFSVKSQRELESAAHAIYQKSEAMAVCAYEEIKAEYRMVYLDGKIRLAFSKIRSALTGDGVHTLGELLGGVIADGGASGFVIPPEKELSRVLAEGEMYLLNWKHNLGQGAHAEILQENEISQDAVNVVMAAAKALGIRFASVDVILTEEGWKILEVNGGVMMEHFAGTSEKDYAIAKEIYRDAILTMLAEAKVQSKA